MDEQDEISSHPWHKSVSVNDSHLLIKIFVLFPIRSFPPEQFDQERENKFVKQRKGDEEEEETWPSGQVSSTATYLSRVIKTYLYL